MFGATAGYNWQKGPWVAGVEAAVDWTSIAGSSTVNCFVNCRTADTFIAMLNGRVGYAAGSFLAFVSGGVAVGDVKLDIGTVSASDDTRTGWNVGGGVEYKFMPDWSAKVQYNFVQFGTGSCGVGCGGARVPLQQNLLLLGINRHLF
jgi:outer membrane immunogenic protein